MVWEGEGCGPHVRSQQPNGAEESEPSKRDRERYRKNKVAGRKWEKRSARALAAAHAARSFPQTRRNYM